MDSDYHQFGSPDNSHGEPKMAAQTGMKKIVVYILYGVLVVLLLILLMVTGVKFSQLSKEITDVKLNIKRIINGGTTASHSSGAEFTPEVPLPELVPVRGTCREGWVSFQSNCYLISTTSLTWSSAEKQCQTHGGHLLVFNSVEELDYISKIVQIRYDYWVGLVERRHEGHWSWVDGTDFSSTKTFWDEGQPDDWDYRENGEDCGQIHSSRIRKRKMWNDADCSLDYRYICEAKA
ncbi:asialoglycoprotein receptor-like 1 isoform X2 [Centropristis striata]|uniref:asialoglycoprotein receptor-like 1 isoform X2 n=1 Tax=Centropristis striata TaxID=184440 RepID=UPI0027DEB38B|nr:asialoglycoprotein receptor-like 1 isoform X2 [Centropristis striata]